MKKHPTPVRACLLDIEGVLVRDKRYQPIAGAVAWLEALVERRIPFALVSNNTTHPPEQLVEILRRAGFPVTGDQLITALAMGAELLRARGRMRLLWLGTPALEPWWRAQGFTTVPGGAADAVVLGLNETLAVADLDRALPALVDHEAALVALHRNLFYLDSHGERRFGPGFYCAGLAEAAGREPVVAGKPHQEIYRRALARIAVPAEETLFVSDDPQADLVAAGRLGMTTAFVLSGKYADHEVLSRLAQQEWPDIIAATLADITLPDGGAAEGSAPHA